MRTTSCACISITRIDTQQPRQNPTDFSTRRCIVAPASPTIPSVSVTFAEKQSYAAHLDPHSATNASGADNGYHGESGTRCHNHTRRHYKTQQDTWKALPLFKMEGMKFNLRPYRLQIRPHQVVARGSTNRVGRKTPCVLRRR